MIKQLVTVCVIASTFSILGCSSMNSSYDCPNKAGVSCKSLDQINGMVDSGQIRGKSDMSANYSNENSSDFEPFQPVTSYAPGQPLRHGEMVQRIWVAPYEDTEGNYHQDNVMYTIVKSGHWVGSPVKVVRAI